MKIQLYIWFALCIACYLLIILFQITNNNKFVSINSSLNDRINSFVQFQDEMKGQIKWLQNPKDVDGDRYADVISQINALKEMQPTHIYDLDITICKMNDTTNTIDKRHVTMNKIVGVNPSVDRTAILLDTGIGMLPIPTMDETEGYPPVKEDGEEYACDLKVLSIK